MDWSIHDADKLYNISRWGNGHFGINSKGHLTMYPTKDPNGPQIDILDVIEEIRHQNVAFPLVIRFHDILRSQVININKTFQKTIEEAHYDGRYFGVFPVKVNQMREVVEEILDAGKPYNYGLEAGSRPELMAALAMNNNPQSLIIVNGYKDEKLLRLALMGRKLGRNVIIVIEKYSELLQLIPLSQEMRIEPIIGLRAKLSTRGTGKWSSSSGEMAKFGLTIPEILQSVSLLEKADLLHCLQLFHFHIGSQVTDIRALKDAIMEAIRIYAKLKHEDVPLKYFDVGGGLGIDYCGVQSVHDSSINYTLKEYVEDIVYTIKQVCDIEEVEHPHLVSESGRAIASSHSCVVTNVFGAISNRSEGNIPVRKVAGEHHLVQDMREIYEELGRNNFRESYNDATAKKEEMISAFKLGIISLEERAKIENLYWKILTKVELVARQIEYAPPELAEIEEKLAYQYLCNFSVFQSALDTWAINQILPVIPLHRLNERPEVLATLADITCDSDGKIDQFIQRNEVKKTLALHSLEKDHPYYLGLFLTGAYQDIMGDNHNLFGRLNEIHVYYDEEDPNGFYIEEVIAGQTAGQVLSTMQYNKPALISTIKKLMVKQVQRKKIRPRESVQLIDFYEQCMEEYTYLYFNSDEISTQSEIKD